MRAILIFTILAVTFSCSRDEGDQVKAISNVLTEQVRAWNAGDLEGYMGGYLKSDSLRFASGGTVTFGWNQTLDRYIKGYADKKQMGHLTFTDLDIDLIGPNAAIVFGRWKLVREKDEPKGLFTLVMKKTEAGWRVIHDHTSSLK